MPHCFLSLPLDTTLTCRHNVLRLFPVGTVRRCSLTAQPVDLQVPAASISSHTVPERPTARRDQVVYGLSVLL